MARKTNTCTHPETSHYATTYFDPAQDGWYLWTGCMACGATLVGGVKLVNCEAVAFGPQHRLSPKAKKRTSKKAA